MQDLRNVHIKGINVGSNFTSAGCPGEGLDQGLWSKQSVNTEVVISVTTDVQQTTGCFSGFMLNHKNTYISTHTSKGVQSSSFLSDHGVVFRPQS